MNLRKITSLLLPQISHDVAREIDKEALRGIYYSSLAICLVEAISSVLYFVAHTRSASNMMVGVVSALACSLLCLAGHLVSKRFLVRWPRDHQNVMLFKVLYFIILSAWGIFESAAHYAMGNQMLAFFAVEFVMASFLVIKPWISMLLVGGAYSALFVTVMAIDGAAHLDKYNYLAFMLVTIAGMTVRFHVQRDATQRAISLQYVSTHDELTGLRNRKALDRDVSRFAGNDLVIRMLDVNYFKEFNDRYGHLMGDLVLTETARHLEHMYPGGRIYRFGGDEFLVVCDQMDPTGYRDDTYGFEVEHEGEIIGVTLSIGRVMGTPHDRNELFTLIGWADRELYRVKDRVHS